jgi:hypothetical protein
VALVRTEVSEELSACIIRVTRIDELGMLAITSNQSALLSSPILITLMKEALSSFETRFLQEPHGVTAHKMPFFIVTAMKTSNPTLLFLLS